MVKTIRLTALILLALFSSSVLIANSAVTKKWPPLPTKFIKGQPATKADVDSRKAVFAYLNGKTKSTPINIVIPQYGMLKVPKSGKATRIIVIQAEDVNGMKMVGYLNIQTGKRAVALLKFVELLGKTAK